MQAPRKDLVLCQALRLAASLGSAAAGDGAAASGTTTAAPLSQRSLPAVAAELAERGILPPWAAGVLSGPPAALDLALARAFGGNNNGGGGATEIFLRASATTTAPPLPARPQGPADAPPPPSSSASSSRYVQDFEEIAVLGRGGFGVVVSASNKLDGRRYAVKKIPLRSSASPAEAARILREVATLSRLQHNHVVRYFNCWLEDAGPSSEEKKKHKKQKRRNKGERQQKETGEEIAEEGGEKSAERHWLDSSTAGAAVPAARGKVAAIESEDSSSAPGGGFWQTKPSASSTTETAAATTATTAATTAAMTLDDSSSSSDSDSFSSPSSSSSSDDESEEDEDAQARSSSRGRRQTLFIQMELCPRTLREVLDGGGGKRGGGSGAPSSSSPPSSLDGQGAWRAVRDLLLGLAYLNSQSIIHRDLKPSNLFISARGDAVLIGDFGLSKSVSGNVNANDGGDGDGGDGKNTVDAAIVNNDASDATGAVGTALYIAPEILEQWPSYTQKVDIWSCGVVAFEIFNGPFRTVHERVLALRNLRERGGPPPAEEWPSPARVAELGGPAAADAARRLVAWMLARNPADRPSAADALRSELLPPELEDEAAEALLRSLPDSEELSSRVIDALFAAAPAAAVALSSRGGSRKNSSGGGSGAPGTVFAAEDFAGAPFLLSPSSSAAASTSSSSSYLAAIAASSNPGKFTAASPSNALTAAIGRTFRLRGAAPMASAALGVAPPDLPADAATMLSPSGTLLALRYEFRRPFCEWLASLPVGGGGSGGGFGLAGSNFANGVSLPTSAATPLLRYEVGAVARRGIGRGLPRAHLQADYDVVTAAAATAEGGIHEGGTGGGASADAEVICAAVEALAASFAVVGFNAGSAAVTGQQDASSAAASSSSSSSSSDSAAAALVIPASLQVPWPLGLEVRLNHPLLLRACLFSAGVSPARGKVPAVLGALAAVLSFPPGDSRSRAAAFPFARAALAGAGLSDRSATALRRFALAVPGESGAALARAAAELGCENFASGGGGGSGGGGKQKQNQSQSQKHPASRPLAELRATAAALVAAGAPRERLVLDPLMAPAAEYFSGVFFAIHAPVAASVPGSAPAFSRRGKQHKQAKAPALPPAPPLLAVGGRYDALLRALWPKAGGGGGGGGAPLPGGSPSSSAAAAAAAAAPGGAGATINVGRVATLGGGGGEDRHPHHHHHDSSLLDPSVLPLPNLDVVVTSRGGGGLLRERLAVAAALRRQGVRAAAVRGTTAAAPSARDAYALARAARAACLLTIEAASLASAGTARLRWLGGNAAAEGGGGALGEGGDEEEIPLEGLASVVASRLGGAAAGVGAGGVAGGAGGAGGVISALAAADGDKAGIASSSAAAAAVAAAAAAAGAEYRRPRAWQRERGAYRG